MLLFHILYTCALSVLCAAFIHKGIKHIMKTAPMLLVKPELNVLFPLALWPMHMAKDNIQYTIVCQSARQLNKSIVAVILTF